MPGNFEQAALTQHFEFFLFNENTITVSPREKSYLMLIRIESDFTSPRKREGGAERARWGLMAPAQANLKIFYTTSAK
jgi:hypothetical protein